MTKEQFLTITEDFDNIIFDYGGVLLDIDYQFTLEALNELSGKKDISLYFSQGKQSSLFSDFETGQILADTFIHAACDLLQIDVSLSQNVRNAWCKMLVGLHVERMDFLIELSNRKRIFILSNINSLHEDHLRQYIDTQPEFSGFYEIFEKVYFSHLIGARKPHAEAFDYVIKDSRLDPLKTFFIDDSLQHVEGARNYGISAYHLTPSNSLLTAALETNQVI